MKVPKILVPKNNQEKVVMFSTITMVLISVITAIITNNYIKKEELDIENYNPTLYIVFTLVGTIFGILFLRVLIKGVPIGWFFIFIGSIIGLLSSVFILFNVFNDNLYLIKLREQK